MKNKIAINAKYEKLLLVSIGLGVFFWILEAAIHSFIFTEGAFIKQIFFPNVHEIWMRSLVISMFVVFGSYTQIMLGRERHVEEKIKLAYTELNQIFNTAADAMRVIDKNFNVLRINDTFSALVGISKNEAVGKKCYEVFHGPMCHTPNCPLIRIMGGEKRIECDVDKERCDGIKVPCILTATPFAKEDGEILSIVEDFKDIRERKNAKEKLERLNKKLLESNKKLQELTLEDSHTGLYNHRYLEEAIKSEFYRTKRNKQPLSVLMLDVDYFKSINDVYGHQFGDLVLRQLAGQLKRFVRHYDIVIRFGGEEFIIIIPETNKSTALILAQRLLSAISLHSFGDEKQVVKLRLSGAVSSYPEDKISKGMELIDLADQILNKAKEDGSGRIYSSADTKRGKKPASLETDKNSDVRLLKGKIDKLTKRANQSLIEAIFAFAKTIELKDHYTGEHVERTVDYATETAGALKLSQKEIERIREASRLHDLGKVGISEKILLKPARLNEEEFEEIKKHPQIGVDIIRPIQSLRDIIPLILYHQERWDGKGYPQGLKGEEIPIGARIIAVADVYQALISDRPYRKAYSEKEAVRIIEEGSSIHFDPKIADIFLEILRKKTKD
ncbi:MAG: diguanylate cyclase [Candidatus Omnitrophota bacterium]|nr:MAG: diguanylate cyclase [Candidatus Omnitrophota bacterium]